MKRFTVIRRGDTVTMFDGSAYPDFDPARFDSPDWRRADDAMTAAPGRGDVVTLQVGDEVWVKRHYHRGGLVSRVIDDSYWWTGLTRSRPYRELELLKTLRERGLPVPIPVAARLSVAGLRYRADLVTVLVPDARPLSRLLAQGRVGTPVWEEVGRTLARFHAAGVDHPDLTAHNILVDEARRVWVLDFDNARLRSGRSWKPARISRLNRPLNKAALETGTDFDTDGWEQLLAAYSLA